MNAVDSAGDVDRALSLGDDVGRVGEMNTGPRPLHDGVDAGPAPAQDEQMMLGSDLHGNWYRNRGLEMKQVLRLEKENRSTFFASRYQ